MTNRRHGILHFAGIALGALALLLLASLMLSQHGTLDAQGVERGQTIPNLPATIVLTKTVGIDADACAPSPSLLVPPETVVYYCYQVQNTSAVTLKFHQLFDDDFAEAIIPDGFHYDLQPDELINTVEMGFVATRTITRTTTNFAQWESYVDDDLYAQDDATATVTVRNPQNALEVRVGAGDGCAGTSSFLGASGYTYSWCVKLTNTGEITLTEHTLEIPLLNLTLERTQPLAPDASIIFTYSDDAALGPYYLTGDLNLAASVTSTHTEAGVPFTASATALAGVFLLDSGDSQAWLPVVGGKQ